MQTLQLTAVLEKEADGYVALCPELDIASQGDSVEESTANLKEAVQVFLECASRSELKRRYHPQVFVTRFEGRMPKLGVFSGNEVWQMLQAEGFVQVRQHGSHIIMQRNLAGDHDHRSRAESSHAAHRHVAGCYPAERPRQRKSHALTNKAKSCL